MAKLAGLSCTVTMQNSSAVAKDISNDIADFSIPITFAVQDVTGIDKSAQERIALLVDSAPSFKGFHNNATDRLHQVVSTGQTVPRQIVATLPGGAGAVLTETILLDSYVLTRAANAALTNTVGGKLSNGTAPAWS